MMTTLSVEEINHLQDAFMKQRLKLERAVSEILRLHSALDDTMAEREDLWGQLQRASLEIERLNGIIARRIIDGADEIQTLRETVAAHEGQIYALGGRP